ncbi:hypothetical protein LTR56_017943 [Elasticomyces elasticus]|nr:hypothetical protein LTR56_017943 [Elasticomyces elasticus]KAK3647206.1 hypothetical protein LTR22_013867 [Elasticomyces elasticus]KAK4913822.1 hypothetical protein LTR49_017858 [Elasticomyces elasticus]KAK5752905.1 hypothetical protein LTS12_016977 [Elasticomyces elasticus]
MNIDSGEASLFQEEGLAEFRVCLGPTPDDENHPSTSVSPLLDQTDLSEDPGNAILFAHLDPNRQDLIQNRLATRRSSEPTSRSQTSMDPAYTGQTADAEVVQTNSLISRPTEQLEERHDSANAILAAQALKASADAHTDAHREASSLKQPPAQVRVDSAQNIGQSPEPNEQDQLPSRLPLKLNTSTSYSEDSGQLIDSPTLRKHVISVQQGNQNTLPVVQPTSPTHERDAAGSPARLPSFRQFTGQLNELAEAASIIQEPRIEPRSRHHSQSFSSTTAQSPRLPYHPFPGPTHASPMNQYAYSARSPTSTISEMTHGGVYGSPTQYAAQAAYFADRRRSSMATEHPGPYAMPPSLPSASSTESHGPPSSTMDGYSTANTTPIDQAILDGNTPRPMPMLPPPLGMPQSAIMMGGSFVCDWDGCNAQPFQTQYLLSSHKNVHSSTRPYFCPVQECPRSEGGKGFKRKNEMIRHGLVHNSPGYVCPFCPDREHRYPRPDNLQRHVRVHHMDKDKDDATLREVLAQRIEGAGKQRRRRTNAHGSMSS